VGKNAKGSSSLFLKGAKMQKVPPVCYGRRQKCKRYLQFVMEDGKNAKGTSSFVFDEGKM
jgi:hypothetical protein